MTERPTKCLFTAFFGHYNFWGYGGPNGELGASMRYLSQRYTMPYKECMATLTDIGTEELGHFEMIATIVHQLTRNMSMEELKASGFEDYYVDHTLALWPQAASGTPFTAAMFQSVGDPITDLTEDMAAEEKARTTYDKLNSKNFYAFNPAFDTGTTGCGCNS